MKTVSVETVFFACMLSAIGGMLLLSIVESVLDWFYQRQQEKRQQEMAIREARRRSIFRSSRRCADIIQQVKEWGK